MTTASTPFPAEYQAELIDDFPAHGADAIEFCAPFASADLGTVVLLKVVNADGDSWIGGFKRRQSRGTPGLTGVYSTPNPRRLCVVIHGDAYLINSTRPTPNAWVATGGPVTSIRPAPGEGLLLLASPWKVSALDEDGVRWQSPRLAIEGIRLDEVADGRVAGVADPDDEEPRDFVINLRTGVHSGGADIV